MDRFPDSLIAFQRMFPHDDACAAWLASVRWPEPSLPTSLRHQQPL